MITLLCGILSQKGKLTFSWYAVGIALIVDSVLTSMVISLIFYITRP
jgi:hypothetical protein